MALVPIIQPMAIKLVTTKKERRIHMDYSPGAVSRRMRIAFPIVVTLIVGLVGAAVGSACGIPDVRQPDP